MTEGAKSKYSFEDMPGGFLVKREGGLQLGVTYGDSYIHVGNENVGIYCFGDVVEKVAEYFLDATTTRRMRKRDHEEWVGIIGRALAKRMKPHWQRLVDEFVPEEIGKLARLMWSSVHGDAAILHRPLLYTEHCKHLRNDLLKYHACRLFAKKKEVSISSAYLLDHVSHWREELLPHGAAPKAVNKTLDAMPRALSYHQIVNLANVHLNQPITNRLHLIAVLSGADHYHWPMHEHTFLRATPEAIQQAAEVVGWQVNARSRTDHIRPAMRMILDYPIPYNGDIVGLARRSNEWHAEGARMPERPPLPSDLKLPLLELDYEALEQEGVIPLRTVGDVVQEGDLMHHCVGSYAEQASKGYSYLFHVEHNGEWATVELSPSGHVVQACGPHNRVNSACSWGAEQLREAAQSRNLIAKQIQSL